MPNAGTSIPDYLDRRAQAPSLESLAIFTERPRTLAGEDLRNACAWRSRQRRCSKCFAPGRLGRTFTADEGRSATSGSRF